MKGEHDGGGQLMHLLEFLLRITQLQERLPIQEVGVYYIVCLQCRGTPSYYKVHL